MRKSVLTGALCRGAGGLLGVLMLLIAGASQAGINTVVIRNTGPSANAEFKFRVLSSPAKDDAAAKATFSLATGKVDGFSGSLDVLHDGQVPRTANDPRRNFFFQAGTDGGRLRVDLGGPTVVDQISTYSWHTSYRAPQVYRLYASSGAGNNFDARPAAGTDPAEHGWTLISVVDTRAAEESSPTEGQHAVSIFDADGPLGSYRYLLFEIARTDNSERFSNTYYSEIDVIGSPVAEIAESPGDEEGIASYKTADGKYDFTIDTSDTPALREWATKELAPVVQKWYPKIVEMLPSDGFEPPQSFSITFSSDDRGVASTSGARIRGGEAWFLRSLQGEAKGAMVHELVHVAQQYGRARRTNRNTTRPPGWLVEGIPDYIRWYLYEPESGGAEISARSLGRARYDGSYRVSANFLNWAVQKHDASLIAKLNTALREGAYTDELWEELTGSTVQELDAQWKADLQSRNKQED